MFKKRDQYGVSITIDGQDVELAELGLYVTAIDLGTELFQSGGTTHRTNTIMLWIMDDHESVAISLIRKWVREGNKRFELTVSMLADNDRVTDCFVFKHAQLNAMQHSLLTTETDDQLIELQAGNANGLPVKRYRGYISATPGRKGSTKLLQIAFAEMEHHILDTIQ